ncbi:MAG: hypothetical protein ACJATN_002336 [Neolewinella sp.]
MLLDQVAAEARDRQGEAFAFVYDALGCHKGKCSPLDC